MEIQFPGVDRLNSAPRSCPFSTCKSIHLQCSFYQRRWDFPATACHDGRQKSKTLATCYAFWKRCLILLCSHILLIHLLAVLAAVVTGYSWHSMIFPGIGSERFSIIKRKLRLQSMGCVLVWILVVVFFIHSVYTGIPLKYGTRKNGG